MQFLATVITQAQPPAANQFDPGNLLGWLAGCMLAALVVTLIVRPLLLTERGARRLLLPHTPQQVRLEGLHESAEAEQKALEELDFDRELGIIEEQDYTELKQRSSHKLNTLNTQIGILQRSLAVQTSPLPVANAPVTKPRPAKTVDIEKTHLKSAIKEKLKCSECGTAFKPGDRFCRQCQAPLPVLCLNCGQEVTPDDRFCARCGAAVNT